VNRILLPTLLICLAGLGTPERSHAQYKQLCCSCRDSTSGQPFVTPTAAIGLGGNPCVAACASNRGDFAGKAWLADAGSLCPVTPPGPPPPRQPTPQNLRDDVAYSVGHQGARIWVGTGDTTLKGEQLRASLAGVEMNSQAIRTAPVVDLEAAALLGTADCVNQRNIDGDFHWVFARGGAEMRAAFQSGDYNQMRVIFSLYESHDDQLRNRLYCRNGSEIKRLMNSAAAIPISLDYFGQPLETASLAGGERNFAASTTRSGIVWAILGFAAGLLLGMIAVVITIRARRPVSG
jgi:hypothetical protein